MADSQQLKSYVKILGMRGIAVAILSRLSKLTGWPRAVSVPVPLDTHPRHFVSIRLRTPDLHVFYDVFVRREYEFELPSSPRFIIDAGAYTGLSSVFFALRYPEARIVAIEPERENFAMLVRNTRPFRNVVPIHAALWNEETNVHLFDPKELEWGYRVLDPADGAGGAAQIVPGITVQKILREQATDRIDILKLDIEGSEKEVLGSSADWIGRVGLLATELHERWKPGCEAVFDAATAGFDLKSRRGEKTICRRS